MSNLKKEMLKIKVKGYFENGELRVDPTITVLVAYYVDKARHNIETASLLMEASGSKETKKRLKVSEDFFLLEVKEKSQCQKNQRLTKISAKKSTSVSTDDLMFRLYNALFLFFEIQ